VHASLFLPSQFADSHTRPCQPEFLLPCSTKPLGRSLLPLDDAVRGSVHSLCSAKMPSLLSTKLSSPCSRKLSSPLDEASPLDDASPPPPSSRKLSPLFKDLFEEAFFSGKLPPPPVRETFFFTRVRGRCPCSRNPSCPPADSAVGFRFNIAPCAFLPVSRHATLCFVVATFHCTSGSSPGRLQKSIGCRSGCALNIGCKLSSVNRF
jgi:hypothetical protein